MKSITKNKRKNHAIKLNYENVWKKRDSPDQRSSLHNDDKDVK